MRRGRRRWVAVLVLPLVVLAAAGVLTLKGLNGSSVGALYDAPGVFLRQPALVHGVAQRVRSDEFALWTPNLVSNVRQRFPLERQQGLTTAVQPATNVSPLARDWSELFKPYDWALLAGFPLQNAFSARWWGMLLVGLLGVYALLLVLTRRVAVSAGLTLVAVFTPACAWWTNQPAPIIGSLAGASALLVLGMTARRRRWAVAAGLGAGYLAVMAVFLLYPPWILTVGMVCGAVVVGAAIDRRVPWKRLALLGACALAVVVPALGAWGVQSREAIEATRATYYPGQRVNHAGGAVPAWMFSAPSSYIITHGTSNVIRAPFTASNGDVLPPNQSEVSSPWMPLPLLVVTVGMAWAVLRRRRAGASAQPAPIDPPERGDPPPVWATVALAAVTALLLSWAFLPLPQFVGSVTLLSQVPGRRMIVPLGWAAVLSVALGYRLAGEGLRRRLLVPAVVVGALAWAGLMTAALMSFTYGVPVVAPVWRTVAWITAAMVVGVGLTLLGGRWGAASLVAGVVAFLVYAPVNPLYRGLGPLQHDPLVIALREIVAEEPAIPTVVFGKQNTIAITTSAGVTMFSGVTPYPDRDFWQRWAPDQEVTWNRYANWWWEADTSLEGDGLELEPFTGPSIMTLRANPCGAFFRELGVRLVVSEQQVASPCLTQVRAVERPLSKTPAFIYRVTRQS